MSIGEELLNFFPGKSPIEAIDISQDGSVLAVGQWAKEDKDPTLSLWDLQEGTMQQIIKESEDSENSVLRVNFNPKSNKLIYVMQHGEFFQLVCFDLEKKSESLVKKSRRHEELVGFAIHPKSGNLFLPIEDAGLEIWDLDKIELLDTITIEKNFKAIDTDSILMAAFSRDAKFMALAGFRNGSISLYDTDSYNLIKEFSAPFTYPRQILFDFSGKHIALVDFWTKGAFIWEIDSGERYLDLYFDEYALKISCMDFSSDNKYVAVGYNSSLVALQLLADGEEIFGDKKHSARVYAVKITPDGDKLVSTGEDGRVIVRSLTE